jgi:hypothetical protein
VGSPQIDLMLAQVGGTYIGRPIICVGSSLKAFKALKSMAEGEKKWEGTWRKG